MKKLIIFLLCLLSINNVKALELNSKNAVLYNLNENKVVYEMNKDEKTNIASLPKIMTTLVAIEHIKDYNLTVTIKSSMFTGLKEANAAVIGLRVGQVVTYNDLLYGMFVASGADATRALVISIAGSESEFVKIMNQKAKDLGLKNTKFSDTTGLDEANQYSTVDDVATVLKEALNNSKFKELFTAQSYTLSNKAITVYSTLRKTAGLYNYDVSYIEGAKTGYNYYSGKCLASVAYDKENDIRYLLVTTKASTDISDAYHIKDAVLVYNYYFENYKYHNLIDEKDLILTLPTKYGKVKEVKFYAKEDVSYYLENTFNKDDVVLKYNGVDIVDTKMEKGFILGSIDVIYNNDVIKKIDVVLEEKVEFSLFVFIKENVLIVSIVLILLITILIFSFARLKKKVKRIKK